VVEEDSEADLEESSGVTVVDANRDGVGVVDEDNWSGVERTKLECHLALD
jgi:hypothetical protein